MRRLRGPRRDEILEGGVSFVRLETGFLDCEDTDAARRNTPPRGSPPLEIPRGSTTSDRQTRVEAYCCMLAGPI